MKKFLAFLGILLLCVIIFFVGRFWKLDPMNVAAHLDQNGYNIEVIVDQELSTFLFDSEVDPDSIDCFYYVIPEDDYADVKGMFFSCDDVATARDVVDFAQSMLDEMKATVTEEEQLARINNFVVKRVGTLVYYGDKYTYEDAKGGMGVLGLFDF